MIVSVMHEVGEKHANVGAATLNAIRQIGALYGVAVMVLVLALIPDWGLSIRIGFNVFAICLLRHCIKNPHYVEIANN